MRQYPIWNIITACIYNSAKSYGVKNTGEVEIRAGTSSKNSHVFLKHAQPTASTTTATKNLDSILMGN